MHIKNRLNYIFPILLILLISSCASHKKLAYIKNSMDTEEFVPKSRELYDAIIQPKDLLNIAVSSSQPEATSPFNSGISMAKTTGITQGSTVMTQLEGYLVSNDGYINFPLVGRVYVLGKTTSEVERTIEKKLKEFITIDIRVTAKLANYEISVLGEVKRPGTYQVKNEKVNLLQALAMAGDMTIYGRRNSIKLIRENLDGQQEVIKLDLTDANVLNSPYFYLKQNDVIYVEPNKAQAQNAAFSKSTSLFFTILTVISSLTGTIITILK